MEQDNQEQKTWLVSLIGMIFIVGIFAIASLFLVNIGVQVYKNVVVANNDNFQLRTTLSYVATKVRQADVTESVSIEKIDGLDVLALEEEISGMDFVTYLYFYNGVLYEHFMEKDGYFEPGYGMKTFEIADFSMNKDTDGMLRFTATNLGGDREELQLQLRSN